MLTTPDTIQIPTQPLVPGWNNFASQHTSNVSSYGTTQVMGSDPTWNIHFCVFGLTALMFHKVLSGGRKKIHSSESHRNCLCNLVAPGVFCYVLLRMLFTALRGHLKRQFKNIVNTQGWVSHFLWKRHKQKIAQWQLVDSQRMYKRTLFYINGIYLALHSQSSRQFMWSSPLLSSKQFCKVG